MPLHNFNCFAHSAASFIFIFACAYYTNPFDRQLKVPLPFLPLPLYNHYRLCQNFITHFAELHEEHAMYHISKWYMLYGMRGILREHRA